MIGTRMTMARICAFGVYVIGADGRNASVFKGPTQCCLTVECVVSIEIRRSDEDRRLSEWCVECEAWYW